MPLSVVLQRAGLAPDARYIVFYCADRLGEELGEPDKARYYESIGLDDAFHPQTILAYDMNGARCLYLMEHRFAFGWNASSATRWPSTS